MNTALHGHNKSFARRAGRMTAAQQRGWEQCWKQWGLSKQQGLITLNEVFHREAPTVFEIGFGMGHSLQEMAQQQLDKNFIGVEVYRPGIGGFLHNITMAGLTNVRVFCDDAVEVLTYCIPQHSLSRIQIYFPDPWHKKKHNKRRLIQPELLTLLHNRLTPGGTLHLATDWQHYAAHMMHLLSHTPGWVNYANPYHFMPNPDRPSTKFERRGKQLGHHIWDLSFIRI